MTGLEAFLVRLTLPIMRYISSAFSHIRKANGIGASHSVKNCAPNKHYLEMEVPRHVSIISNLASNSCPQDVQWITSVSTLNSSERIPMPPQSGHRARWTF